MDKPVESTSQVLKKSVEKFPSEKQGCSRSIFIYSKVTFVSIVPLMDCELLYINVHVTLKT